MIDCYLCESDKGSEEIRGYPIVNEKQRESAKRWAGTDKYIQIPDVLTGVEVVDLVDRLNNKIFKVKYQYYDKIIIFDMYAREMLDVMQESSITKGIIQGSIVFLDGGRLALRNGFYHKLWLAKNEAKEEVKKLKRIPISELQVGHVYKTTPNGDNYIFLGKRDDGSYLSMSVLIYSSGKMDTDYCWCLRESKTLNYKIDTHIVIPRKTIIECFIKRRQRYLSYIEDYARRIKEDPRSDHYWEKQLQETKDTLESFKPDEELIESLLQKGASE